MTRNPLSKILDPPLSMIIFCISPPLNISREKISLPQDLLML